MSQRVNVYHRHIVAERATHVKAFLERYRGIRGLICQTTTHMHAMPVISGSEIIAIENNSL